MFLKITESHQISFLVTDIHNQRITTDSPYAIIKNTETNQYWNGIQWSNSEFRVYLSHVLNGVYQYRFTPDTTGRFEISICSDTYQLSKFETLEVYDADMAYKWVVNSSYTVSYGVSPYSETVPTVTVFNTTSRVYIDGQEWVDYLTENPMMVDNQVATYVFIPNEIGEYLITIKDGDKEYLIVLDVIGEFSGDDIATPLVVTSASLKSLDGTDCVTTNEKGMPIAGVKVQAYNPVTKECAAFTHSNQDGQWSLLLKPGQYYFMFEKDGFTPLGFVRTVS